MRESEQVGSFHGLQVLVCVRICFGLLVQVEVEHVHEIGQLLVVGVAPLQELVAAQNVVGQIRCAFIPGVV